MSAARELERIEDKSFEATRLVNVAFKELREVCRVPPDCTRALSKGGLECNGHYTWARTLPKRRYFSWSGASHEVVVSLPRFFRLCKVLRFPAP